MGFLSSTFHIQFISNPSVNQLYVQNISRTWSLLTTSIITELHFIQATIIFLLCYYNSLQTELSFPLSLVYPKYSSYSDLKPKIVHVILLLITLKEHLTSLRGLKKIQVLTKCSTWSAPPLLLWLHLQLSLLIIFQLHCPPLLPQTHQTHVHLSTYFPNVPPT